MSPGNHVEKVHHVELSGIAGGGAAIYLTSGETAKRLRPTEAPPRTRLCCVTRGRRESNRDARLKAAGEGRLSGALSAARQAAREGRAGPRPGGVLE